MRVSLLTSIDSTSHVHLIIGSNPLAASRCAKSLEVGAKPILIAPETAEIHYALQQRIDNGEVQWLKKSFEDTDVSTLGRQEIGGFVDVVFVTHSPRDPLSLHISTLCKRHRVPVNVVDAPSLCTFSLLSTHTDGPLQIGVTTNGKGCKLSSRIRREIASSLPRNLGAACERFGTIRRRIQAEDQLSHAAKFALEDEESLDQSSSFNALVKEADLEAAKGRRLRWLSQICEYWPLSRLADVTDADIEAVMASYSSSLPNTSPSNATTVTSNAPFPPPPLHSKKGLVILAARPAPILSLIPRRTRVHIARKFPGNAERAQDELLSLALEGLQAGETVLRLKQGDPYLYGRGGEEVEFFTREGWGERVVVLPGITSALSAPLFASVPATQRAVADQVLICTGTGRKGVPTKPPTYVRSQTVVFLMALHRISGLVEDLTTFAPENAEEGVEGTNGMHKGDTNGTNSSENTPTRALWPPTTPCAVIERASCPDQRVIRTTLSYVAAAIEAEGSRPPGLLVLGAVCEALWKPEAGVGGKGKKWVVEEGFRGFEEFGGEGGKGLEEVLGVWGGGDVKEERKGDE